MDTSGVIQIIFLFVLVFLSGFFSSAETSLTTVNQVRIRTLVEEGNKRAKIVEKVLKDYGKMLSTILIGNNIVNISASSLATSFTIRLFGNAFVGITTGILTFIILMFGEIVPKTWAMYNAEKISLAYSRIIYSLMFILTPVIYIIDKFSDGILHLLRIDTEKRSAMTEKDLKTYVDVSHEDGVIESGEREIIYNVFDFSDALAKDIMIPRINMVSISIDDSYDNLLEIFKNSMYTRIPVYENEKDNIIGLVNIKDFILVTDKENFKIADIIREAHYTYEYKKTADLMIEMREQTTSITFVLNEYGVTVGMITLEDLLEEIVGEIRDEYDEDEEELIQKTDTDRQYLVEGTMKLDDINDALGTDFDSEDYDSISGLVIETLDRLPEDGEEVSLDNGTLLKVQGIDQNRIIKVLMTLPEPKEEPEDSEDAESVEKEEKSE